MNQILRSLAVIAAAGGLLVAPVAACAHTTVNIVASNWKFTPNAIELHVGETVTLRVTSSDGVHGLQSDELGIPMTTITPGTFTTVQVTPKKAGKYVLHCAIMCGPGHPDMTLTVNVVP